MVSRMESNLETKYFPVIERVSYSEILMGARSLVYLDESSVVVKELMLGGEMRASYSKALELILVLLPASVKVDLSLSLLVKEPWAVEVGEKQEDQFVETLVNLSREVLRNFG